MISFKKPDSHLRTNCFMYNIFDFSLTNIVPFTIGFLKNFINKKAVSKTSIPNKALKKGNKYIILEML